MQVQLAVESAVLLEDLLVAMSTVPSEVRSAGALAAPVRSRKVQDSKAAHQTG